MIVALKLYDKTGRRQLDGIIRHVKQKRSWLPEFVLTEEDLNKRIDQIERLDIKVEGFILGALSGDKTTKRILDLRLPTVLIGKSREQFGRTKGPIVFANNDNQAIAEAAAGHLLSLGAFSSYGYVPWIEKRSWCEERQRAFISTIKENGHEISVYGRFRGQKLGDWLKNSPKPLAIFAACDRSAVEVFEECYRIGLNVPEQVAILGVDDDELCCESTFIPISSIDKDDAQLGYMAARRLTMLVSSSPSRQNTRPVVYRHVKIVVRESTSYIAPSAMLVRRALAFIKDNARRRIAVDDVVRHLGVSRSLVEKRFRTVTGKTIHSAIAECRMDLVRHLLSKTNRSMGAIAAATGYGTPNHLKKVFRETFGVTMTQYRKDHKDEV